MKKKSQTFEFYQMSIKSIIKHEKIMAALQLCQKEAIHQNSVTR